MIPTIANIIDKLFDGDNNLIVIEVFEDWISLYFKDVNEQPQEEKDIHIFIKEEILKKGIDLEAEGLRIRYCDGNFVSIQP